MMSLFVISSCEEKEAPKPEPVATSIKLVSGSSQAADVGIALVNPIEVIVKDQDGKAFKGAKVTFSVAEGSVSTSTATTDASGKAKVTWTLGLTTGEQTLTIKGYKSDGTTSLSGSPITVKATATVKVASSIEIVSGDNQTADTETTLNNPVTIIVKDKNGDPFEGETVSFAIAEGSLSSTSETSNENGLVSVSWILGATAGTQSLTVTAFKADGTTNLTGSPLTVNAVAIGDEATTIALAAGGDQTGSAEAELADSVKILVKDQHGDAFPGATVNFEVAEGSVSSASKVTNANGYVSVKWTLGATVGTQELTVTAFKADGTTPLSGSPITVSATATQVISAYEIELVSGDNQTTAAGTTLAEPIKIKVKDQNGDGYKDVTVYFSVAEGSADPASEVTDYHGNTQISWTLGSTVGTQTLTITAFEADGTTPLAGSPLIVTATATEAGGSSDDVTDYDGNVYKTVVIGSQIWMAENLKVSHYSDGTEIPYITDKAGWAAFETNSAGKGYCFYDFGSSTEYGALYTWAAAMNGADYSGSNPSGVQGVCPTGWHMPSNAEWIVLIKELGGYNNAGDPLKEEGTDHWADATGATNASGFSAYAGGYCAYGNFDRLKYYGYWWSTTQSQMNRDRGYCLDLRGGRKDAEVTNLFKSYGMSVRCVKD